MKKVKLKEIINKKVLMKNEKNGFNESIEFEGILKECKIYLKTIIDELKQNGFEITFDENFIEGYGDYGYFTYEII